MKIPKSWVHFKEIEGGDDIQYCDGTDVNIVTLNTFKPEQVAISESEYAALETVQFQLAFMNLNRKVKTSPRYGGQNQLSVAMRPK